MENITVFENLPTKTEAPQDTGMEIEGEEGKVSVHASGDSQENGTNAASQEKVQANDSELDALYPIFWSLQESFSMPTRLFDTKHFQTFRQGLQSTIRKFQTVHQEQQARGTSRLLDDSKRTLKRKRNSFGDEVSNSINPRYLTSRDLFDLEVGRVLIIVV